jgi:uncharacterized protein
VSALEVVAVLAAGLAAGTINTVVGSGTLITFPVLLAIGLPPVVANVTNTVGLVPGSVSGAIGMREELRGQGRRAVRIGSASLTGALLGAAALLTLPEDAFRAIVPAFIAAALALVVVQPRLGPWLERRRGAGRLAWPGVFVTGIYGGYFGAAQGILLLGVLGLALPDDLHRVNALKNVLAAIANGVAAVVFIVVADVDWPVALLVAAGAVLGGVVGARVGRRLPPHVLRGVIVVVGLAAIVQLLRPS